MIERFVAFVKFGCVVVVALASVSTARAQSIQAIRIESAPRLDGRLAEAVWRTAPAVTQLTQREPNEGAPAIENTEVRFAYDDDALYVGARMFSANPRDIRALVTRRDNEGTSERIVVSLDTYHDRRTAFTFAVTPAGVRLDSYHDSDFDDSDEGFDPVWDARAHIDSLGWTAEMRIPFTQLRFSPLETQVWGLNVVRHVPARNEESYWMLIRREETGWGESGPKGLTQAAHHMGYADRALPSWHFYPVAPDDHEDLFRRSALKLNGSRAVHLWNNLLQKTVGFDKNARFDADSPFEQLCRRYLEPEREVGEVREVRIGG